MRNIHHVHVWQIGEQKLMTLHAQVIPPHDHDGLLQRIQAYLLQHYKIGHVTIQMEYRHCETPDCGINRRRSRVNTHMPKRIRTWASPLSQEGAITAPSALLRSGR